METDVKLGNRSIFYSDNFDKPITLGMLVFYKYLF